MPKADDGTVVKDETLSNGQLVSSTQPSAITRSRERTKPRRSWISWFFGSLARLTVWYSIYLILFSCPTRPQDLTPSDSRLCKPYLSARSYVEPYVGPYYNEYADPYVQKIKPYTEIAAIRVIRPATVLALSTYNKYAAPQVEKARQYTMSEWERRGLPQLRKAQEAAQQAYDENLAAHVQKASEVASPYYETARENAFNVHERHIVPAITSSQPHLHKVYLTARKFVAEKAVPFAQNAYSHLIIFIDGTLWPFVKKLYTDNVQPQIVMIGERIAKYQEGRKLQSAMDRVDVTESSKVERSSASTSIAETTEAVSSIAGSTTTDTVSSSARPSETVVATDDKIQEDLTKWQQKFAVAADTGTDDLKERIEEIVVSIKKVGLSEGHGLATALERTAEVEMVNVKAKINSVVSTLPEDPDSATLKAAEAEIAVTIRQAGSQVKEKAQSIRLWSTTLKTTLQQRTEAAADLTLHILDDIRDLGLQEIGMRWAWMDGVTYRHWQKYHDLKRRFADWRAEVRETALSDPAISEAQHEADQLLEESMSITETAAKELVRLRDVAKWKVAARDASDDFDSRAVPIVNAAISAASAAADNIKRAVVGTQGSAESLSSVASDQFSSATRSASSLLVGTTGTAESVLSSVSSLTEDLQASASSVIIGSTGSFDSLLNEASSTIASGASIASSSGSPALSEVLSTASSVIIGTSTGSLESLSSAAASAASAQYNSASSVVSSATVGPSDGPLSSISSAADSVSSFGEAAFSSVSASERLQQAFDDAGDNVAGFTSSILQSEP